MDIVCSISLARQQKLCREHPRPLVLWAGVAREHHEARWSKGSLRPMCQVLTQTPDTLTPETSACTNQTQMRPHLKILGNHFHRGVFTSALSPRTSDGHHTRTLIFISEGCGSFGFAMVWLCRRTSAALAAVSPPFLCPGVLLIHGQHDQHTGMVLQRGKAGSETLLLLPVFTPRNNFPGESIPTPSPGVSSFTTDPWLHHSALSFLWPPT